MAYRKPLILKHTTQKQRDTIFGYIKSIYNDKDKIPMDVICIILLYHCVFFEIYKEKYGPNLKFIDQDGTIIIDKPVYDGLYSTCLLSSIPITNKICDKFSIQIQVIHPRCECFLGYVTKFDDIKNYRHAIGYQYNKDYSTSLYIHESRNFFRLNDKKNTWKYLSYKAAKNFTNGDKFMLTFDFIDDSIQIYHNSEKADKISLNGNKSVIPGVSLGVIAGTPFSKIKLLNTEIF